MSSYTGIVEFICRWESFSKEVGRKDSRLYNYVNTTRNRVFTVSQELRREPKLQLLTKPLFAEST
jgi:hypothetical protein